MYYIIQIFNFFQFNFCKMQKSINTLTKSKYISKLPRNLYQMISPNSRCFTFNWTRWRLKEKELTFILVRNRSIRLMATKRTSDGRSYQTLRHLRTWADPSRMPAVISDVSLLDSGSSKCGWNFGSSVKHSSSFLMRGKSSSPGLSGSIPGVNGPCNGGDTARMAQGQACLCNTKKNWFQENGSVNSERDVEEFRSILFFWFIKRNPFCDVLCAFGTDSSANPRTVHSIISRNI